MTENDGLEQSDGRAELLRDVTILTRSDLVDLLPYFDETKPWEYLEPLPEAKSPERPKQEDELIWVGKKRLQPSKKRIKILDERVSKVGSEYLEIVREFAPA